MNKKFTVVSDSGMDAISSLRTDVPVASITVHFGSEAYALADLPRDELVRRIAAGTLHPTTAQPSPQAWLDVYRRAAAQAEAAGAESIAALAISSHVSGSFNAAQQARDIFAQESALPVRVVDSRIATIPQSFMVNALGVAADQGESVETGLRWAEQIRERSQIFFTTDTLEYLKRGGRIDKVAAALGGMLHIKPIITWQKAEGTMTASGKVRGSRAAWHEIAAQITRMYGEGTPLQAGFVYGMTPEDTQGLREEVMQSHPLLWEDNSPLNPSLMVHSGPHVLGVGVYPGKWPWEE